MIADAVELLIQRAHEHPGRGYSFYNDGAPQPARMSYAELEVRARSIAAELAERGAKNGEPVLILCPPGLDYIAAFFGCLAAGCIAVPAYPPEPMRMERTLPRLLTILEDTRARIVLSTAPIVALPSLEWIRVDACDGREDAWRRPSIRAEAIAFLQYTSGSTSQPKGVMISHQNLLHNLERIKIAFEFNEASRSAYWLPPYHDMGLVGAILSPLYAGGDVALMSPIDFLKRPMSWLELISKTRADSTGAPNFAYDLCVRKSRDEERSALDLSSLTLAFNASESIRAETLDAFAAAFACAGFEMRGHFTCYGLAESTLFTTGTRRSVEPARKRLLREALERNEIIECRAGDPGVRTLVALGAIPVGTSLLIVDPEKRSLCTKGQVGEIWLASGSVAEGYWNHPPETAATFGARLDTGEGPFLRTGDLGFVAEGELYFVARIKEVIIIRGRNHYPHDLEQAIEGAHPALRRGCAVAFPIERDGEERLAMVCEVDAKSIDDHAEVIRRIKSAVSNREGIAPDAIVLIEAKTLPKTSSGKLQRSQTRSEYERGLLSVVAEWRFAPQARSARTRAETLEELLIDRLASSLGIGREAIDPDLPFQGFGLDSKAMVELAAELSAEIGCELPATLWFDYPTITVLAAHLRERGIG